MLLQLVGKRYPLKAVGSLKKKKKKTKKKERKKERNKEERKKKGEEAEG